jgi:hypothetical protein
MGVIYGSQLFRSWLVRAKSSSFCSGRGETVTSKYLSARLTTPFLCRAHSRASVSESIACQLVYKVLLSLSLPTAHSLFFIPLRLPRHGHDQEDVRAMQEGGQGTQPLHGNVKAAH